MGMLLQDFRFAMRTCRKNPGFSAVVVLILALGIGANVAVFNIVYASLFKGLPLPDAERIVIISDYNKEKDQDNLYSPYPEYLDIRAQVKNYSGLAAAQPNLSTLSGPTLPTESVSSARVSTNTFSLIGAKPLLGRDFLPHEDQGAGSYVAILSYKLWKRRFGGDAAILGKTIRMNEIDTEIVGVMPEGMQFPYNQEIWYPLFATSAASGLLRRESRSVMVYGRLAEGSTLTSAQAELDLIAMRLQQEYPQTNQDIGIQVERYVEFFHGDQITVLFFAMLGAVAFVLLIACANVANLLLARSLSRSKEISIRASLGATRWRIIRQLLVESALLGVMGSGLGLMLSYWAVEAFKGALPPWVPYWLDYSLDLRVYSYIAGICGLVILLFGLVPALHASKADLNRALKEGTRGAGGARSRILSRVLVVCEVSLALMLLVGAGLMIRSFVEKFTQGVALQKRSVMSMEIPLSGRNYLVPEPRVQFMERLEPELNNIAGVSAAALASSLPLSWAFEWPVEIEGRPVPDPQQRPRVFSVEISPGYFEVLGIPLLRGRTFHEDEGRDGRNVAVVNRRFAEKHWPGEDPIGRRFRIISEENLAEGQQARTGIETDQPWITIVGESADVKHGNPDKAGYDPAIYVPYRQTKAMRFIFAIAATPGDPGALAAPMRRAVQTVNDQIPVLEVMTIHDYVAQTRWMQSFFGTLFAIFAAVGLILALAGIYAVMAYSVSQRTREIGIRMAFGAQQTGILKLIVGQAAVLGIIGVGFGVAAALGITRLMGSVLYGVGPTDTATFLAAALLLLVIAMVASYLPARRASLVNPVDALRMD